MRPLVDTFDDRVVLDISDQIPTPKTNIATGRPTQTHSSKIWSHTTIGTGLTPSPFPPLKQQENQMGPKYHWITVVLLPHTYPNIATS